MAALHALDSTLGVEIIAEELKLGHASLGEITGQVTSEDLLGAIFASLCIGK
jgi:tRNA modification GTPase